MRMISLWKLRWGRILTVFVVSLSLLMGAGIASAAVSGSFSTSYDGWEDGPDPEVRGHEIKVTGTIEVTGDSAVEPRIIVTGSDHAILDKQTVEVLVEGERSIQFDRVPQESRVVYRADEIPPGTTLRVEYTSYYIGGADSGDVTVGSVNVNYQTPGGDPQRESFAATNPLEDRPENVISELRSDLNEGSSMSMIQAGLSAAGVIFLVYIAFRIVAALRNGDDEEDF